MEHNTLEGYSTCLLDSGDVLKVRELMADVFIDDPMMEWIADIPNGDREGKRELVRMMNSNLSGWINRPILARNKGAGIGVTDSKGVLCGAITVVPSAVNHESFVDSITNLLCVGVPPMFAGSHKHDFGPMAGKRLKSLENLTKKRNIEMPKINSRWIYVQQFGILDSHRGHGLGRYLLEKIVLGAADSLQAPVYLETETNRTEAFYHHLGFRTADTYELCGDGDTAQSGYTMYCMLYLPCQTTD